MGECQAYGVYSWLENKITEINEKDEPIYTPFQNGHF
jgi:hypothetical protein